MIALGRNGCAFRPCVVARIVHECRVDQRTRDAKASDDDDLSRDHADGGRAARRRERRAHFPRVLVCSVHPESCFRNEARAVVEPADRVERVVHDGQRHVVARLGQISDALPVVATRVVPVGDGSGFVHRIDAAGDVDLSAVENAVMFLNPLGNGRGRRPRSRRGRRDKNEHRKGDEAHGRSPKMDLSNLCVTTTGVCPVQ